MGGDVVEEGFVAYIFEEGGRFSSARECQDLRPVRVDGVSWPTFSVKDRFLYITHESEGRVSGFR